MNGRTAKDRLADLRAMQRTGRQVHPDGERPVGAALAARLPAIVATAAERVKLGARPGRVQR